MSMAWLSDSNLPHDDRFGRKATTLGLLRSAGFPVPQGFVVSFDASVDSARMPAVAARQIEVGYQQLCAMESSPRLRVAVRSSASDEDDRRQSNAGAYESVIWVAGSDAVLGAARRCWLSMMAKQDRPPVGGGALLVQRAVDSRVAGVAFTANPLTRDRSAVAVEASWGFGGVVVGGLSDPDFFLVDRVGRAVLERRAAYKEIQLVPVKNGLAQRPVEEALRTRITLSDTDAVAVAGLAIEAEGLLGGPQDVEWSIDRSTGPHRAEPE